MAKTATNLTSGLFSSLTPQEQPVNIPAEPITEVAQSKPLGRPKLEKKDQKTFYLSQALAKQLRVYAAIHDLSQSDIVEAALKQYLQEKP